LNVVFYQFGASRNTLGGRIKDFAKRKFVGGASITSSVLSGTLGRPLYSETGLFSNRHTSFDLAAISFNTPGAPRAYQVAERIKKMGKIVIAGGPHCSLVPQESLAYFDAVCVGPGDVQFSRMVEDAHRGMLQQVYYGQRGEWVLPQRRRHRGLSLIQLSRGCYQKCRLCVVPGLYGNGIDEKPMDLIEEELKQTSSLINIVDDNFPVQTKRGRDILSLLKKHGKRFICQTSVVSACNAESLTSLAQAGCILLGIGLESIRSSSREFLGKEPVEDPKKVLQRIHEAGIASYVNFVFGSDGETPDIFDQTLQFIDEVRPGIVSAHLLTPFPGTGIYDYFSKSDRLLFDESTYPEAWSFHDCRHVTFIPSDMTVEELRGVFSGFLRKLYSLRNTVRRAPKGMLGASLLSGLLKNAW
jgi:radical SAM superfamily enzyme YgiQ (UPF0313 family)